MSESRQPWLFSARFDSLWLLSPAIVSTLVVLIWHESVDNSTDVPLWAWVAFILCIDVAHVYSTLYRTYFDPVEFNSRRALYIFAPIGVLAFGICLYSLSPLGFWRTLAYLAVFHFIRQQYGFLRLYSRNDDRLHPAKDLNHARAARWIDAAMIYAATLVPIILWHVRLPRNFHWFIDGDFISGLPHWTASIATCIYCLIIVSYVAKEVRGWLKNRFFNLPKNICVAGTALSWWIGIVTLNGDLAFTITNVVSHGIPYMALIWAYGRKQSEESPGRIMIKKVPAKTLFSNAAVPIFIGLMFVFAYFEEGLWHGLVWRERLEAFGMFQNIDQIKDHSTLSWLIPLLALPQATHYVLDGFIWRVRASFSKSPQPHL